MKISPFDRRSSCPAKALDHSYLGFHVASITLDELAGAKHGIVILGLPDDTGIRNVGGRPGAKLAPAAVRGKLYRFTTGALPVPVYDLGDLVPEPTIEATHSSAALAVRKIREAGHFPIVIGGGHDLGFPHALGQLEASGQKKFRLVNIDAHLDVRPVDQGITSGSPWYLLAEHPAFVARKGRISQFGIQAHCNAELLRTYARGKKMDLHWLPELGEEKQRMSRFRKLLGPATGTESLVVSFDIDSVASDHAPGCSAPQTVGFSAVEAIAMSHAAGSHARVESFGIFECSPPLDPDSRTSQLVAHCIRACCEGFAARAKGKKR